MSEEKKRKKGLSRRDFMKATGGAAAMAGVAAGGLLISPGIARAYELPGKWDQEADVVIVGFGGAGACAAIEAAEAGASVIIIDKAPVPGGSTTLSGGVIYAAGTALQKKAGIQDTPDEMFKYLKACGQGIADDKLLRVASDMSAENVDWLGALGVEFTNELLYVSGMEKVPEYAAITPPKARGHRCVGTGGALFKALKKGVDSKKITTMSRTEAVRLIARPCATASSQVVGVQTKKGGKDLYIFARKAVILASGGIMASEGTKPWLQHYSPDLAQCLPAGDMNATGDGYRLGMSCGAALAGMNKGALLPSVMLPGYKMAGIVYINIWGLPNIYVDSSGKRFVDEAAYYVLVAEEMVRKQVFKGYSIFDSNTIKKALELVPKGIEKTRTLALGIDPEKLDEGVQKGYIWKGQTPAELAGNMKVDPAVLEKTIQSYNSAAAAGQDKEFGRTKGLAPLNAPPYYAFAIHLGMVAHSGGLKINEKSQVLDTFDQVIPRLYAAGRDAIGIFGGRYPGSGGAISCLVAFGRIAGKQAAAEKNQEKTSA